MKIKKLLILLFINLFIISISCNASIIKELFGYEWNTIFYEGILIDESKIINISFYFYKDKTVEIIENKANYYSRYIGNYKEEGEEVWIYYNDPDMPFFVFKKRDNNIIVLSPASSMILKNIEKKVNKIGLSIIKYNVKFNNLRLRESQGTDGKFIRSLIKGEKLELLEKGKEETINGVKGTWVKVRTEKGEVGWCFDAYLEEVK